jgi:surface antigen
MVPSTSLFSLAAVASLVFVSIATVFLTPDLALAAEPQVPAKSRPAAPAKPAQPKAAQVMPGIAVTPPTANAPAAAAPCQCSDPASKERNSGRPKFAELPPIAQRTALDETDEIAALESVQFALSEVGDGASYVWHRNNGRLSGMVQPVASFRDQQGQICRHVLVILTAGTHSKKAEGVACRLPSGQWKLEG